MTSNAEFYSRRLSELLNISTWLIYFLYNDAELVWKLPFFWRSCFGEISEQKNLQRQSKWNSNLDPNPIDTIDNDFDEKLANLAPWTIDEALVTEKLHNILMPFLPQKI